MDEMRKEIVELIQNIDDKDALEIIRDAAKELSDICLRMNAARKSQKQTKAQQK